MEANLQQTTDISLACPTCWLLSPHPHKTTARAEARGLGQLRGPWLLVNNAPPEIAEVARDLHRTEPSLDVAAVVCRYGPSFCLLSSSCA